MWWMNNDREPLLLTPAMPQSAQHRPGHVHMHVIGGW